MKLGVISDTHGKYDIAIEPIFKGVDLIIHAGDIGDLKVVERLQLIAPVFAVEGNNDSFGIYPAERSEYIAGRSILIRHIFGEIHQLRKRDLEAVRVSGPDIIIFGHSHKPYDAKVGQTLLFNPGSAGPRRFSLPRTVGVIHLEKSRITSRIVDLEKKA
ncbi:MAG TPA: metallophosphoesterase family protein [Blastocatellia bacterium]